MQFLQVEKTYTTIILKSTEERDRVPLGNQIQPFLESSPHLILDCRGITFTSMQIGELASLAKAFNSRWEGQPHALALFNLSETSAEALKITNLLEVLSVFKTVGEALAKFGLA